MGCNYKIYGSITLRRSREVEELLDALRECPEGSIFQHSFQTLEEHHFTMFSCSPL